MNDRLLIIGPTKSGKFTLLQKTFDFIPNIPQDQSHQGLIHRVKLDTRHYSTALDLWIDEYADIREWCQEFKSDEAKEAREVINGIIWCFNFSDGMESIQRDLDEFIELIECFRQDDDEKGWDGLILGVGKGDINEDDKLTLEDLFIMNGVEFIDSSLTRVNEFNEKTGYERVREVIECHDWSIHEFKEKVEVEGIDGEDRIGLLDEIEVDVDQILNKLNIAKQYVSKLDDDAKHEYALKVIKELDL